MNTLPRTSATLLLLLPACSLQPVPSILTAELLREVARTATRVDASTRTAHPGKPAADIAPDEGERRITVGVGFTDSPETFLVSGDAEFYQSDRVSIGPSLQLGVDDNVTIVAPSFHARLVFPLEHQGDSALVMPFLQAGAGLAFIHKDKRGNNDDFGFMLQAGGGLEVRLDENYALSSTLLVNIMPSEVNNEGAYVSWQILQLSFVF